MLRFLLVEFCGDPVESRLVVITSVSSLWVSVSRLCNSHSLSSVVIINVFGLVIHDL